MLKIISKISMILFLCAVPFLFYGFGAETLRTISSMSLTDARPLAFLVGAGLFFPFHFVAKRIIPATWSYLQTLEHELAHLLIGLLFLKIPIGIRVSAHEGGEVRQIGFGTTGQTWVTLAPYFFPTVSIFVVVVAYFASFDTKILLGFLGFTTAFHLITNWAETSFRQPDLQKAGILKTLLILPVMNLICYGAVFAFVVGSSKDFGKFWTNGFAETVNVFLKIWR